MLQKLLQNRSTIFIILKKIFATKWDSIRNLVFEADYNAIEKILRKKAPRCSGRHYLFVDNALDKSIKIAESIRNAVKFFF